jgi:hypothetical protein
MRWFSLPRHVSVIEEGAFSPSGIREMEIGGGNRHFRVSGAFLVSFDGTVLVSHLGRPVALEIPPEIEVISHTALSDQESMSSIEFGPDSRLRRIEPRALAACSGLRSICIPRFVDNIDGTAFLYSPISEVRVADGNRHFQVSGDFILSSDGKSLITYFGDNDGVTIPGTVEVIRRAAFCDHIELCEVEFEGNSQLRRIDAIAFSECTSLRAFTIPPLVSAIAGTAFQFASMGDLRVAEANQHFRVVGPLLLSVDGKSLIAYLGPDSAVEIPREVEVISAKVFSGRFHVPTLEIGTDSQLRRIDARAFVACSALQSLYLPSYVDTIAGSAFFFSGIREIQVAEDNRHFRVSGGFLIKTADNSLVRYFGESREVKVLSEIESLSSWCFCGLSIQSLSFENDSRLRRMESRVFFQCWAIHSICIPPLVEFVDGSVFAYCGISRVEIAGGNGHFRVSGDFLMSADCKSLIHYFGEDPEVRIGGEVEDVSDGAFSYSKHVRGIEFETPSRVRRIGRLAFEKCWGLRSISLPSSVESLSELSFRKCRNLQSVRFESGSKLARIERESFMDCSSLRSICIPRNVEANEGLDLRGLCEFEIGWYE